MVFCKLFGLDGMYQLTLHIFSAKTNMKKRSHHLPAAGWFIASTLLSSCCSFLLFTFLICEYVNLWMQVCQSCNQHHNQSSPPHSLWIVLTVHSDLALVVASCRLVRCKLLHASACGAILSWTLEIVSVTTSQCKCLCENVNHVILLNTHSSLYTTDMAQTSTINTQAYTLNSLSPNALHVHM